MCSIPICDAHAHIASYQERTARLSQKILTCICAVNPNEASQLQKLSEKHSLIIPAYGLHPWEAQEAAYDSMLPYLYKASIIGEIGMDSVWCNSPLPLQKKIFQNQLEIAELRHVPIVLHTKGQEAEVLDCIQKISVPILAHWYSCEHYLEDYIDKDCYFTVGPDASFHPLTQRLIKKVALNRLLVETDGWNAVVWAAQQAERPLSFQNITDVLLCSINTIAEIKKIPVKEVSAAVYQNFIQFFSSTKSL